MRIGVLGSLQVVADDGTVTALGGTLERRVLACLATQPDATVALDTLTEAVFDGVAVDGANERLQNHISRLRKRLGATTIVTSGRGYRLSTGSASVDWQRFEYLLVSARRESDPSRVVTSLAEALSLWRGHPLPELENWSSAQLLAGRLAELRRGAEEDHTEALLSSGSAFEAVVALQSLVVEEPLRERRWALLMLALQQTGRHADALRAYQRASHELGEIGLEPGHELRELERTIAACDPKLRATSIRTLLVDAPIALDRYAVSTFAPLARLPVAITTWFGDESELRKRADDLPTRRLVTLTGPGGVGKTRAAVEMGRLVSDRFAGGVWFLDLAPIADPNAVAGVAASMLAVAPQPGLSATEAVIGWLRGRCSLLIVDNCEHLLGPVTELVGAINESCETVTVLATSREPLGLPGERVLPIHSLSETDALNLFRDRAESADDSVCFTTDDEPVLAKICTRLDGIPLAIELIAARIRSATPTDLLGRLDDRFRLLRGGERHGIERHQTLLASVGWSYRLLSEVERMVFDRLSVFAGSFDAPAAVVIGGHDGRPANSLAEQGPGYIAEVLTDVDILHALDGLVDKSMVVADRGYRAVRYRLLETLRQYGEDRLFERGETLGQRDQHLAHFLSVADRAHRLWSGSMQADGHAMFERDWDNLRAAHQWAIATRDLTTAARLVSLVHAHSHCRMRAEVGDWAQQTLDLSTPESPVSPDLFGRLAHWRMYAGDHDKVFALAECGIAAASNPEHPDTTLCRAFALVSMMATGRIPQAASAAEVIARTVPGADDPFVRSWGWSALCLAAPAVAPSANESWVVETEHDALRFGSPFSRMTAAYYRALKQIFVDDPPDPVAAHLLAIDTLHESRTVGDRQGAGQLMLLSVFATLMGGGVPDAESLVDTIALLHETRNWLMTWVSLESAGVVFARTGDIEAANVVEGFLEAKGLAWGGIPRWSEMRAETMRVAAVRAHLDADRHRLAGASMDPYEIVSFTLQHLDKGS